MREHLKTHGRGYLFALAATTLALLARYVLSWWLPEDTPTFSLVIAVLVSAWYGGLGPGLLATVLSLLVAIYFFVEPYYSFAIASLAYQYRLIRFTVIGVIISALSELRLQAIRKLLERQHQLEAEAEARKKAEARLREREAAGRFLTALVESSADAIISKSLEGVIQTWNASAERLFGYPAEEAVGRHISIIIPPARVKEEEQVVKRLCTGERIGHFDTVRVRCDGTPVEVSLTLSPIQDEGGQVVGISMIVRDVTERKLAEENVKAERDRVQMIADAVPALICYVDAQGCYQLNNHAYKIWFGHSPSDNVGRHMREVLGEAAFDALRPHVEAALRGQTVTFEAEIPYREGGPRWINATYTPDRDEKGMVRGFIAHINDITQRKLMEQELRHQAEQLTESDRKKDEFLSILAHELRNPLAPIRMGLEAMRLAKDEPDTLEDIRSTMERQTQQLMAIVDDLLDVSRITRGKLELRRCPVKLADVIQSAVEASRPFIEEASHELSVTLPEKPISLHADPHRLAQVLSNLLGNAAKYTPEGGRIALLAERQGSDVLVKVQDNGIGIPQEMVDRIFEMFAQIDRPMEKNYTGLGIGLTLVKSLVQMHGGTVEVHSEGENRGSEFRVRLPILVERRDEAQKPDRGQETVPSEFKHRVLVVDDNKAAAELLGMVVRMLGHEVRTAGDGQEGFEVAEVFLPDVVLMDLGMPRMNGFEAARKIREQPWGQQMRLIALTGWGQAEDKQRTKEAGFDHHLVKPAEPAELQRLLASVPVAEKPQVTVPK